MPNESLIISYLLSICCWFLFMLIIYLLVQYSGPSKDVLAYANWLREDPRFSDILVQVSPAINGHAFPKLKLRYKPSLVQVSQTTFFRMNFIVYFFFFFCWASFILFLEYSKLSDFNTLWIELAGAYHMHKITIVHGNNYLNDVSLICWFGGREEEHSLTCKLFFFSFFLSWKATFHIFLCLIHQSEQRL